MGSDKAADVALLPDPLDPVERSLVDSAGRWIMLTTRMLAAITRTIPIIAIIFFLFKFTIFIFFFIGSCYHINGNINIYIYNVTDILLKFGERRDETSCRTDTDIKCDYISERF